MEIFSAQLKYQGVLQLESPTQNLDVIYRNFHELIQVKLAQAWKEAF